MTCIASAELSVNIIESFDEMRMASATSVSPEEQALVDQVFNQMKSEKTTQLKAKNTKSELILYLYKNANKRTLLKNN
jgi:hypothetical protein